MTEKDSLKKILDKLIDLNMKEDPFLLKRNLIDVDKDNFGKNHNSESILNYKGEPIQTQSFVSFSVYPDNDIKFEINNKENLEWLKKNSRINLNGNSVPIIPNRKTHYDLDSVTFNNDFNARINRYTEFIENGYIEQGFARPLIWNEHDGLIVLDLCRTTGLFWSFLIFIKNFYEWQKYTKNLEIRLVIHNSNLLTLSSFGGTTGDETKWADPHGQWYDFQSPSTYRKNIQIIKSVKIKELTEKNIPNLVRIFSDKLSNAYDIEFARCYNHDGTFNFEKFTYYDD